MKPNIIYLIVLMAEGCILHGDPICIVKGELDRDKAFENEPCEITLWTNSGYFFQENKPKKRRTAKIGSKFKVQWMEEGDRWVEISCPRHEIYRSPEFDALTGPKGVDLGVVKLKKLNRINDINNHDE